VMVVWEQLNTVKDRGAEGRTFALSKEDENGRRSVDYSFRPCM